jgi:hypothetical protein
VFVSHAGEDLWVAEQIAKSIANCGADTFLDRRDIAAGDNFKRRIHEEIPKCNELLALFTPWSRRRAWVRHEIGMADMLRKRIVCPGRPENRRHQRLGYLSQGPEDAADQLPSDLAGLPIVGFDPTRPELVSRELVDRLLAAA